MRRFFIIPFVLLSLSLSACTGAEIDESGAIFPASSDQGQEGQIVGKIKTADGEDDLDHDLIPDSQDNCPSLENPDQADSDQDGIGDACQG